MGFLSSLFGRKDIQKKSIQGAELQGKETDAVRNEQCFRLLELEGEMRKLFETERYVARSEFLNKMEKFRSTRDFFQVLESSGMLAAFCEKNGLDADQTARILDDFSRIQELADRHNEDYIRKTMVKEKEYLDHILQKVDPKIMLDEDQRKVVLTDEDACLVVAGAGAGKTTTVAAKVKYLTEKQGVDPLQILVVSFTNKAVKELQEKINGALGIPCPVSTFHSAGNAIIRKNSPDERLNIVDSSRLYFVLRDYFRNSILKEERMVNKLILFFASYFDAPYEGDDLNTFFNQIAKSDFSTMRSDLEDFKRVVIDARTKKSVTIQNEVLRSHQEVEIANFLYLNRIDYEYEPVYPFHILYARKPYTPDFIIRQDGKEAYIEHFGISESGENDRYSSDELEAYKRAVRQKVRFHREHGTTLIYTFSAYKDRRTVTAHLKEKLEEAGFELRPRSGQEVLEKLVAGEENRYIRKLLNLICRFISNFKVNGYTSAEFDRMYHATQNVRTRLFLEICQECYLEYEKYLKEHQAVDFQDMINESARILREVKELKQKLDFRYIIVDEYQDISRQRFDLTKALSEVTNAKIIAVGDDWQSIYAFSGSDITLFTRFEESMGYAKLLKIVKTYRNSQEVIDIAGNFIQKNQTQIRKTLESPKHIEDPVIIYTYDSTYKGKDGNRRSGANYSLAYAVQMALEQILEYSRQENLKPGKILLLGRFGFDGDLLERSGLFEFISRGSKVKSVKYPEIDMTFMTAHASKGLGYDNVIVINGKNETYGFPSKVEDDPVLAFVIKGDRSIDYAEERRLFYVAMTRTKNRVYFVAPEQNPSEFLLELKRDYKNVVLYGHWNEESPVTVGRKYCPICGYPLQYKYKNAYGLRLHLCTNEPEICSFMTNDLKGRKLSIMKCSSCRDGYLIVKRGTGAGCFLGCTNYKKDQTGCGHVIGERRYYEMMGYVWEPEKEEKGRRETEKRTEPGAGKSESPAGKPDVSAGRKVSPYGKPAEFAEPKHREEKAEIQKAELEPVLYMGRDLNEIAYTIVSALLHVSQVRYYGTGMLLDVLRGASAKRLLDAGLYLLPEYGALKSISREEVQAVIEWLIENHYMLRTKERYPVLHPTYDGLHYGETMTGKQLERLKKYLEEEAVLWNL